MAYNYLPESTVYTISPYSSHGSNVVNRLTRTVSGGNNCILGGSNSLQVTISPSGTEINISTGKCIIDDVLIEVSDTTGYEIDLTDSDNFINGQTISTETGNYYLCIYYKYVKSRTTPKAYFRLYHPSDRGDYNVDSNDLLIKIIEVTNPGGGNKVTDTFNGDPDEGYTDNARQYVKTYSEFYDVLPTWATDFIGRLIVVWDGVNFEIYIGGPEDWILFQSSTGTYSSVVSSSDSPLPTDDIYPPGTIWINTTADTAYVCTHQADNTSIWVQVGGGEGTSGVSTSSDPTSSDDGYDITTIWVNTSTDSVFVCVDNTSSNAIWKKIYGLDESIELLRSHFLL
jgi:hypothetical protein